MIQFSKLMVEQVYEIRRLSPPELKKKIKMSSQTLFDDLREFYPEHSETEFGQSVKVLFSMTDLNLNLEAPRRLAANEDRAVKSNFRSGVESGDKADLKVTKKRKIIYRGQVTYVD